MVALLVTLVSADRRIRVERKRKEPTTVEPKTEELSEPEQVSEPEKKTESTTTEESKLAAEEIEVSSEKQEPAKQKPDLSAHKPDKKAVIKTMTRSSDLDGNYQYQFESSNGIASNEGGVGGQIVQGSTTWIAKNGEPLAISFVADENGYRPMGFHLPTPPPIPLAIQRALAHLATKKPDANDDYYP